LAKRNLILGIDELSEDDKLIVARARQNVRFLSHSLIKGKLLRGISGSNLALNETPEGLREFFDHERDSFPDLFPALRAGLRRSNLRIEVAC
jgi:F-type H+/Na+-transporting ATPase subunit beta